MSVLSERHAWIRLLVLFVAAGALGFAAGFAAQERATAGETPFPSDLFPYTYSSDQCTDGSKKDPINVVFTNHGFASEIRQQAANHGGWDHHSDSDQYFGDQYRCRAMDDDSASNSGLDWGGRFHVRYYNHKGPTGGRRTVANFGSISSGAAHHDDSVVCGLDPKAHAVDDDSDSFTIAGLTVNGGFNRGREDIRKNWVVNSDHVLEITYFWDNKQRMEQCDGQVASSDGWVYYIRTFDATTDYDGDGCTNERELQIITGSETSGGRRDPANFWDFFDTPDPNATPQRDRVININDVFRVAARFPSVGDPNIDPLSTPPKTGYHPAYDRGDVVGPNPWNLGPADGAININDIFWVSAQFTHVCA